MQQRPNQPYQGGQPLRQIQQPRVNSNQPDQQGYAVQNVFSPQSGLQSPFLNNAPQYQQQQQQQQPQSETTYYASNPSPRSTHSGSGAYYAPGMVEGNERVKPNMLMATEKPDSMAATATMQRPAYPPIYHTPQSNSPASVTSPQSHDHGRPMFTQPAPQLAQPMYGYPQYQSLNSMHQPPYGSHHSQPQSSHQMSSQPMLPYQSSTPQMQQGQVSSHPSALSSSPRLKSEASQHYQSTPQARSSMLQHQQSSSVTSSSASGLQQNQANAPPANSNAAPGPIPATTPLVVRQDGNGVQWIAFEYSRDRVKMEYTIRCDVESVIADSLSPEFKSENCVYPRACVPKEQYKGNRLAYETDCNQVGWALAELNPCLRGKRGLIQRAVDSWRNSNQDPRLRSRRVRRQAKMNNRSKLTTSASSQTPGPSGPMPTGLPGSGAMAAPSTRPPGALSTAPQQLHHHQHSQDVSPTSQDNVGGTFVLH